VIFIYIFLFFLQVICTPGGLPEGGGRGAKNSRKYIWKIMIKTTTNRMLGRSILSKGEWCESMMVSRKLIF